jgi:hypothetical protein
MALYNGYMTLDDYLETGMTELEYEGLTPDDKRRWDTIRAREDAASAAVYRRKAIAFWLFDWTVTVIAGVLLLAWLFG